MRALSEIEMGPIDAAVADKDFLAKYVEESNFRALLDNQYTVITGEKGSGKTALIKGLTLKHAERFTHIININFDEDISFSPVAEHLSTIAKTTGIDALRLMLSYWQYALVIEVMKEVIGEKRLQVLPIEIDVYNYLVSNKHIEEDFFSRLLNLCTTAWRMIEVFTRPKSQPDRDAYPHMISPDVLSQIRHFPLHSQEFARLMPRFADYLKEKKHLILVTLDGFDILRVTSRDDFGKLALILEGLIGAIYRLSTGAMFMETILNKALVPYDIYLGLALRDADKYESRYTHIRWDYTALQEFLRRRIFRCLEFDRTVPFEYAWHEVMPKTVRNTVLPVEEQSYDYILRHTLYRPRHIQVHLQMIGEAYPGRVITGEMVSEVMKESTKRLVRYLMAEHSMTHPKMHQFIMHFRGKPNVWDYGSLRKFIGKILSSLSVSEFTPEDKIDVLYCIGFLGLKREVCREAKLAGVFFRYRPPLLEGSDEKAYVCDFHHVAPEKNITHGLEDSAEIVIHPMFYDYCGISVRDDLIIG